MTEHTIKQIEDWLPLLEMSSDKHVLLHGAAGEDAMNVGDVLDLLRGYIACKVVTAMCCEKRAATPSEKAKPESEEAKALIADAARYRWLKNAADVDVMDEILMQKIEEWDSLIDTQIAFDGVVPVRPERNCE